MTCVESQPSTVSKHLTKSDMNSEKEPQIMPEPGVETEAELEAFRQQWREEVSARNKKPSSSGTSLASRINEKRLHRQQGAAPPAHATSGPSTGQPKSYNEEIEPKSYHDLPDKEESLKLGTEGQGHDRAAVLQEPSSALEHYERAVERETQGNLSESMRHYRKAFKLDDGVHEAYKRKHFPPSFFAKHKPANPNPSGAPVTVPNTAHHSLHGGSSAGTLPATLRQLLDDFSTLRIEAPEPETSLSPQLPCPIAQLPEELLTQILTEVAVQDVASFTKLAQVCKRLAYLIYSEDAIWKRVSLDSPFSFTAMHYDYTMEIEGDPLTANDEIARYLGAYDEPSLPSSTPPTPTPEERTLAQHTHTHALLHRTYASSWRHMFRTRPRLRFNGCYISTVNYTRPGATSTNTLTWGAPVHVVTYFRYLRFFRDGGVISLLSTAEPADVVHHLTRENLHARHGASALPSSVMKDALRGRWRLSGGGVPRGSGDGDGEGGENGEEAEGDVFVETEGVVPKYTYKMHLALAHAGKGARNNKLAWKGFYSYNKLTDDWGEFGLRNDRAYYWSRVRSYGLGE